MTLSPHLRRGGEPLSHQAKRGVTPIAKPEPRAKAPRKNFGSRPRGKGNRGEREIINLLHGRGYTRARRNLQSGGQGGADIVDGVPGYSLEVKWCETLRVWDWIAQAAEAASPTETPVVVYRSNHRDWQAILPSTDLRPLLQMNGDPPRATVRHESGAVRLWAWIDALSADQGGRPGIQIVEFARTGADSDGWYSTLLFSTLLDLIAEAAS